jgi:hypothetical protein
MRAGLSTTTAAGQTAVTERRTPRVRRVGIWVRSQWARFVRRSRLAPSCQGTLQMEVEGVRHPVLSSRRARSPSTGMERRFTRMIAVAAATTLAAAPAASAQLPAPLPEVQAPDVQTQIQAPQVQAPQVQLPLAPQPTNAPSPSAPRLRSARSLPSAQPAGAPSGGGQSSGGSGQSGGSGSASSSPSSAGGQSSSARVRASSSGGARAERRPPPGVRREARLRRTVRRLQGCLPALGSFERRVLELRSGIGGQALSVGAVARRLDVSAARVRATEGSGLNHLRRADSRFGCGGHGGGGAHGSRVSNRSIGLAVASAAAITRASNPLPLSAPAAARSDPGSAGPDAQGIAGAQASSSPKDDGLKLDTRARQAAASGSDFPLALIVIVALLLLLPIAALATLRRRGPAAAASEVAAEPPWAGMEQQPAPASRTGPAGPAAAASTRQEPPTPAPTAPSAAPQQERQPTAPDDGNAPRTASQRVGSGLGAGARSLSGGFRDLGRDIIRRARSHRGRR